MEKIITRDLLFDFVKQMWDAGIRTELRPQGSEIALWSEDLSKVEYVKVVGLDNCADIVRDIKCHLLRPTDEPNTLSK